MKNKYEYIIVIILIVSSCIVFGRIADNDFVNFDDNEYITENPYVKSGINFETIKWAFNAVVISNWHPLTLLSHALDWSLFGANPSGHHLISIFLHIYVVLFLFLFLNKTTNSIWPAAFAAAFFALHPLRVESVAWASERKDVLSMFFGMAAVYTYALYTESSKLSKFFLCLIFFALSLMSKPMMVTLPFVLMLLDYWPLGRWGKSLSCPDKYRFKLAGRLLLEKVPFLLLTICSSILTFWLQKKEGSVSSLKILPFVTQVANAIVAYVAYLGKTLWPNNLAVFYPYKFSLPLWQILFSGLILILITAAVLYYIKKQPFLFVGWFWYLGTLIPVIGLVQAGKQAMADRYQYLPSIGIAIILAWGIPSLIKSEGIRKTILLPMVMFFLLIISLLTWQQCGYWKNSMVLFRHALEVTKDNYVAHNNLGLALLSEGKTEDAIYNYSRAISIAPDYVRAYNNRAVAYVKLGNYQRAIEDYDKAINLKNDPILYFNRGLAFNDFGHYQRAIQDYNEAIRLKPDYADAFNNRGSTYLFQGNRALGCPDVIRACELGNCRALEWAKRKGKCH